ncbi:hypothetical protein CC78DRAFT_616538 [Lojkania enalia]|uniref:Uncharacterized protein n=1 Tax=Lojkania enalia TaxID=147567 RepID=A0A9P4KB95_9PLEO|nr:hypothetical protein CC78DRAFT_616538 [Didymosphaeria enalia]
MADCRTDMEDLDSILEIANNATIGSDYKFLPAVYAAQGAAIGASKHEFPPKHVFKAEDAMSNIFKAHIKQEHTNSTEPTRLLSESVDYNSTLDEIISNESDSDRANDYYYMHPEQPRKPQRRFIPPYHIPSILEDSEHRPRKVFDADSRTGKRLQFFYDDYEYECCPAGRGEEDTEEAVRRAADERRVSDVLQVFIDADLKRKEAAEKKADESKDLLPAPRSICRDMAPRHRHFIQPFDIESDSESDADVAPPVRHDQFARHDAPSNPQSASEKSIEVIDLTSPSRPLQPQNENSIIPASGRCPIPRHHANASTRASVRSSSKKLRLNDGESVGVDVDTTIRQARYSEAVLTGNVELATLVIAQQKKLFKSPSF